MFSDILRFLRAFLRHPLRTGAIAPSSVSLARLLVREADVLHACSIAELGCGTGVCTERIQKEKPEGATFIVLEINPSFAARTRERCPGVDVRNDSAVHLPLYLDQTRGRGFDAIISGLPWADFSGESQDQLLDAIDRSLAGDGRFVTFAYSLGLPFAPARRFREKLRRRFPQVRTTRTIWANLPPAFAYVVER